MARPVLVLVLVLLVVAHDTVEGLIGESHAVVEMRVVIVAAFVVVGQDGSRSPFRRDSSVFVDLSAIVHFTASTGTNFSGEEGGVSATVLAATKSLSLCSTGATTGGATGMAGGSVGTELVSLATELVVVVAVESDEDTV